MICNKCKDDKNPEEFTTKAKVCASCKVEYYRQYYLDNKEHIIAKQLIYKKRFTKEQLKERVAKRKKYHTTIFKIVANVKTKYGAPMGRRNIGERPTNMKIYDCYLPMCIADPAYDRGGAYWGLGNRMRVSYSKDLSFIKFYRENENN